MSAAGWSGTPQGRLVLSVVVLGALVGLDAAPAALDLGGLAGPDRGWGCVRVLENPSPNRGDAFGSAVAFEGGRLFVGAPGEDAAGADRGAIHAFDPDTGQHLGTHLPPAGAWQGVGFGGDLAATGQGALLTAKHWQGFTLGPWAAYLVEAATGRVLHAFAGDAEGPAGYGAAPTFVAADAQHLVVASPDARGDGAHGEVHVFRASDGTPVRTLHRPQQALYDHATFGFALAPAGDLLVVGDSRNGPGDWGRVYGFDLRTGAEAWRLEMPVLDGPYEFGGGLALDGADLAVGVINWGQVRVHALGGGSTPVPARAPRLVLDAAHSDVPPQFGRVMRFHGDDLLVAHSGRDMWTEWQAGAYAHGLTVFDRRTGAERERVVHATPLVHTGFGHAFDAAGPWLAVGAWRDDGAVAGAGRVYLYHRDLPGTPGQRTCAPAADPIADCAAMEDFDGDTLPAEDERRLGTDPCRADSDGDGFLDGAERAEAGSDPTRDDTDGDGLGDGAEWGRHRTDPLRFDTDGDGWGDGCEVAGGSDPRDPASVPLPGVPAVPPALPPAAPPADPACLRAPLPEGPG